jgi:hypothetical protein
LKRLFLVTAVLCSAHAFSQQDCKSLCQQAEEMCKKTCKDGPKDKLPPNCLEQCKKLKTVCEPECKKNDLDKKH